MKIKELNIGARIIDDKGISFLTADHNNPFYKGTVLVSEKVISIRCLDEPKESYDDTERKKYGSNNYPESDLHKWLNSEDGFLKELSQELKDAILISDVPYSAMKEQADTFQAKVFIPSITELGLAIEEHVKEGSRLPLFRDFRRRFALPTKEVVYSRPEGFNIVDEADTWCYWLRSSHPKRSCLQYSCHSHGPYSFMPAGRGYVGVRCMICVDDSLNICEKSGKYYIDKGGK